MTVDELDRLDEDSLRERLRACCGARRWVDAMVAARPFGDAAGLFAAAEAAAEALATADWLEAFSHHPRIGDVEALRARFGARAGGWSEGEQAAAAGASDEVLLALADANRRYEDRFGHLFIVCATGKSAPEMLAVLESRLLNEPSSEIGVAGLEQRKITRLRLEKLLAA